MADFIRFDLRGMEVVQKAYAVAPEVVREEVLRFLNGVTAHLTAEVVDRTPTTFGDLRRSIHGSIEQTPLGWVGIVGTPLDYAPPVELGSKPHFVGAKGIDALTDWVKQKIPVGQAVSVKTGRPMKSKSADTAARGIAFAIAQKIARHGTQGAFMFKKTFEANQAAVQAQFSLAVARIVQRIGGSA